MKTFPAILVITVVLAPVSGSWAQMQSNTYISNWSSRQIRASMSYRTVNHEEESTFKDRLVDPYTWESAGYSNFVYFVDVEIWIEGSPSHGWVKVSPDRSIIAFDNDPAIDIYLVKYGKLIKVDRGVTGPLATIYPW